MNVPILRYCEGYFSLDLNRNFRLHHNWLEFLIDLKTRLICSHVCVFDKQFRVVLHKDARGQLSNAIQLGVPQASVLEPLLYLLYTRNIPLQVTQRQRLRMVPIILTNTIVRHHIDRLVSG